MTNFKNPLLAATKVQDTTAKMRALGYLSAPEIAKRLGVHIGSIYRWVCAGEVTATKVGGRSYITQASLIEKIGMPAARAFGIAPDAEVAIEVEFE